MTESYPKTGTDFQREGERNTNQETYVYTQNELSFSFFSFFLLLFFSPFFIAVLHVGRAGRAYWHKCKLPIIYQDTETERERERETQIDGRTYTRTISYNMPNNERNIHRKETNTDQETYTPTMSNKIGWHCYTHLETKREKEIRTNRRTYTRRINDNIPDTETDGKRQKRGSRHVPIYVKSVKI